jgi:spermidine/putrescine transport system permease protein
MIKNALKKLYLALLLIFMYAPIITLIILSFNSSKSRARWGGFTLVWYQNLLSDEAVLSALINTLSIAILATIFSTIIGTVACIAMIGQSSRMRSLIMGVTNIPMINADIVTGISLMLLFRFLHLGSGFVTILLAHITFDIPFVMLSVIPRIKNMNFYVYEAALDLGATPVYAFYKTIMPDIWPGVMSGALMAFTMSIDDFIITYFTKGSGFETISTLIYNEVKRGIQPEIYALSAIIFVVVLALLMIIYRTPAKKK